MALRTQSAAPSKPVHEIINAAPPVACGTITGWTHAVRPLLSRILART
jgi:hypothetical protein